MATNGSRTGPSTRLIAACAVPILIVLLALPRFVDTYQTQLLTYGLIYAIAALGFGLLGTAAAPVLPVAMLAFALAGVGNGLFLVTVRVLMQKLIPQQAHGRAFGLLDAIDSWGFGAAIVAGGALAATVGGRITFAIAGTVALLVLIAAGRAVRGAGPTAFPTQHVVPSI